MCNFHDFVIFLCCFSAINDDDDDDDDIATIVFACRPTDGKPETGSSGINPAATGD